MSEQELVALVCCDLGSIVRGRALFASELERQAERGVGWVPANQALTPLGPIADPNPFGSVGDLRLLPDLPTRVRVEAAQGAPALDLVLCDLVEPDGTPWECCPRRFLRETLARLRADHGIVVAASFEHEFQLIGERPWAVPFSLDALRRAEPFATEAMRALAQAGAQPERVFAEFAAHQFEIPVEPAQGLAAADRSLVLREVVREVARRSGLRATFTPLLDAAEAGNGVHIHLALLDGDGRPLLFDAARPGRLSELGASFAAGVLRHARALSALTASSPVSAERLQPHRWSAGAVCLAERNREALLRIPSPVTLGGAEESGQLHLEYRGADASANPHVALGALLCAGMQGLRERLPAPPILEADPSTLDADGRRRFGVGSLPASLGDALTALAEDDAARGWLGPLLYEAFVSLKRGELAEVADLDLADVCRRYADVY